MQHRVVITGLGVVAPNAVGISSFLKAIQEGKSGIRHDAELEHLKFSCQIAGKPIISQEIINACFSELELKNFLASGILYGVIAGMEAWQQAGLNISDLATPDWDSGTVFGSGSSGVEKLRESFYKIDQFDTRRLGSTAVAQTMGSGVSAYMAGKLGLGNLVTSNSSACSTGTESILMGYERIKNGHAKRMLVGSTSDSGPYIWGGFDAMRVCTYKHNNEPEKGSRPLSETASGFVPGSGAGALVLESLESALSRNATILAEVCGGNLNSGGQRGGGTMTAPNPEAIQRCIKKAIENAGIHPNDIDLINGHLTATSKDPEEILNWSEALNRSGENFPYINAFKSQVGHCLSAAGSIESVATILQMQHDFIMPNLNCEDIHPKILDIIDKKSIPLKKINHAVNYAIKASFGFGDVNACVIFSKFKS
jgi:3-oxoacyl-(acyl-carrier-protein) synthase